MIIPIRAQSMRQAEEISGICQKAKGDLTLRAGRYCVDPRLIMGVLALMYTAPDSLAIDTEDMDGAEAARLREALEAYRADR